MYENNTTLAEFENEGNPREVRKAATSLITQETLFYFMIFVMDIFCSFVAIFGIISNSANVTIYVRQKRKDSVTVTFIALSVWDLVNCTMCLVTAVCFIINDHFPMEDVDILAVQYVYIGYTRGCTYVLSTIVTVYLSVERCICIAIPFRAKSIFTKSRSVYANMVILMVAVSFFAPAWATQTLQWKADPATNRTRVVLLLSGNRRQVDLFVDTLNGVALPTVAQVIIAMSAVVIISGIKASAQFRQQAGGQSDARELKPASGVDDQQGKDKAMTSKDAKVAKVVVLVAIIFFMCNLPVILVSYARPFVPEMDVGKADYSLYTVMYTIVYAAGLVNASVNIFVYYNASSKFKEVFDSLFFSSR